MHPRIFVTELARENETALEKMKCPLAAKPDGKMNVRGFLKLALKNEAEAADLAAFWMPSTPELDVKMGFARQAGDEARHFQLIENRLRELGEDLEGFDPLAAGYGPLFKYLQTLGTSVERVAAGQFTREAIALIKNQQFIDFCRASGDRETEKLYAGIIQPDETFHHQLGRKLLEKYALTSESQELARAAARKTLELAEELQELLLAQKGIHHVPGC